MKNIKAVIFDLDNTLANRSLAFHNYCISFIKEHFQNKELPDTIDNMVRYMVLLDDNKCWDKYEFYSLLIERWNLKDYTAQQLGDSHSNGFYKYTTPDADMQLVLDYLAPKYELGIITNGPSKSQNSKIDYLGIRHRFDSIIVSDDVGMKKPDEQIFILSCNTLGVDVKEAAYIGDHYENDIIGARKAGLNAIWYKNNPEDSHPFEYIVKRLSEILNFL